MSLFFALARLYQQLQRDKKGLAGLTHSHGAMWGSTIETACRAGQMDWALQVSHCMYVDMQWIECTRMETLRRQALGCIDLLDDKLGKLLPFLASESYTAVNVDLCHSKL